MDANCRTVQLSPSKSDTISQFSTSVHVAMFLLWLIGGVLFFSNHSTARGDGFQIGARNLEVILVAVPMAFWCSQICGLRLPTPEPEKPFWFARDLLLFAACGILLALLIAIEGRNQIPGYDGSVYVELAYRQAQSYKPYRDFFCPFPPLHCWGAWLTFHWFPVRWASIADVAALTGLITFIWFCVLIRSLGFRNWVAILLSLQAQASTSLFVCLWEYSKFGSLAAALLGVSLIAFIRHRTSLFASVSLCLALSLVLLSKPNLFVLVLLAGGIALCVDWRRTALITLGAASLAALFCKINGYDISEVLATYNAVAASRGRIDLSLVRQKMPEALIIPCVLAPTVVGSVINCIQWPDWKKAKTAMLTMLGLLACLATSVCQFLTNVEFPFVDYTTAAAASAVVGLLPAAHRGATSSSKTHTLRRASALVVCFFWILFGAKAGTERLFVWASMPGVFFERAVSPVPPRTDLFAQCTIGPTLSRFELDVQQILDAFPAATVFFGPRIEFCYAAYGKPSPRKLPVWWHPGSSYPESAEAAVLKAWQDQQFDVLVFFKNDFTRIPQSIANEITQPDRYVFSNELPTVTLGVRRELLLQRQRADHADK